MFTFLVSLHDDIDAFESSFSPPLSPKVKNLKNRCRKALNAQDLPKSGSYMPIREARI